MTFGGRGSRWRHYVGRFLFDISGEDRAVRLLPLAVVLVACGGCGSSATPGIGFHDLNGDGKIVVLCFGDSITQGDGDNQGQDSANPPGGFGGYPLRLQAMDLNVTFVNAGVDRERTSEGINRLVPTIQQNNPDYVIIDEGINDLRDGQADEALQRLQTMIADVFRAGAMPLVGSLLPTCCGQTNLRPPDAIGNFNDSLKQIAARDRVIVIDFHAAFTKDPYGPVDPNSGLIHVPEGLHPTPHGYDVMAATVQSIFE